jgi:hypothetical protein
LINEAFQAQTGPKQAKKGQITNLAGRRGILLLRFTVGGCKLNAVEPDDSPRKNVFIADGFDGFQPTVGPQQSVTVKE